MPYGLAQLQIAPTGQASIIDNLFLYDTDEGWFSLPKSAAMTKFNHTLTAGNGYVYENGKIYNSSNNKSEINLTTLI